MGVEKIFRFFYARFRSVSRSEREKLLCAMIRINYGTPWAGDGERLRTFFPKWYHKKLTLGGLTSLIEGLSPFSDEPTDPGIAADEITLHDMEIESAPENSEVTSSIEELTTDLPFYQDTQTFKIPA